MENVQDINLYVGRAIVIFISIIQNNTWIKTNQSFKVQKNAINFELCIRKMWGVNNVINDNEEEKENKNHSKWDEWKAYGNAWPPIITRVATVSNVFEIHKMLI